MPPWEWMGFTHRALVLRKALPCYHAASVLLLLPEPAPSGTGSAGLRVQNPSFKNKKSHLTVQLLFLEERMG